ncbi:MAG: aldehyde ferredoxin oxidoreductase family protein [Sedimentisphaerales bacterium]|nr:aldehyde ferredoxin oxidoreductase family protein [Sedimentisphaerales bacterium]
MIKKGGYFGRLLHVDMTDGGSRVEEYDESLAEQFIGGRGFAVKLIWDNLQKKGRFDPLGGDNLLVVAPGPLTGVYMPSSGKNSFAAISPATGIYGDSSMGGSFGVELRQAGYDGLAVHGRAEKLSYLFIDDDRVKVIECPELAGKGNLETEGRIRDQIGDHELRVASIGPAGENLVRFACITSEWSRNSGRCGIGTVMGSKNLKAIVVRGNRDLPVCDLKRVEDISNQAYKELAGHDMMSFWQRQGLMSVIDYANELGILPTYNFHDVHFEKAEQINGYTMEAGYKIGNTACFACPMCCGNINLVKEGKYAGTVTEGPEYETAAMLGSNLGISDFGAILRGNHLCDDLGLDTISTGNLIGAIIEGYEKDLLTIDDLDGKPIVWGDDERVLELVTQIAHCESVGATIALGAKGVLEKWPQLKPLVQHVKGLEQSAYDCRGASSMALAYGTSDIGAHHTRAWTVGKELEMGADWNIEQKVDLVIYHQHIRSLFDMFGVCRLPWIELGFHEDFYAELYSAVVGSDYGLDELLKKSEHIYNMTRAIGVKLGSNKSQDYPPERAFDVPIHSGPLAGKVCDRQEYEQMLNLYYTKRGWDPQGTPVITGELNF